MKVGQGDNRERTEGGSKRERERERKEKGKEKIRDLLWQASPTFSHLSPDVGTPGSCPKQGMVACPEAGYPNQEVMAVVKQ